MASAEHDTRIEIGFEGSQIMSALVTAAAADDLEGALDAARDGTLRLDAEDGHYTVALEKVVYLKRFAREGRLGFVA
ncbi:MAG TPA: hypothetical protein VNB86_08335 [Gaiellaceae bacterium]|jgi:hypothetical protein|nr:hypothetical protein [Gaiellaceae bacterium]